MEKYGRVRQATVDNIMEGTRLACWITKATDSQAKYVTVLAVPRQKWLCERASVLRFYYIACPSYVYINIYSNHGYTNPNNATNKTISFLALFIFLQQCGRLLLADGIQRSVKVLRSNILSSSTHKVF